VPTVSTVLTLKLDSSPRPATLWRELHRLSLTLARDAIESMVGLSNSIGMSPEVHGEDNWLGLKIGDGGVRDDRASRTDDEVCNRRGVVGFDILYYGSRT